MLYDLLSDYGYIEYLTIDGTYKMTKEFQFANTNVEVTFTFSESYFHIWVNSGYSYTEIVHLSFIPKDLSDLKLYLEHIEKAYYGCANRYDMVEFIVGAAYVN